MKKLIIAAFVAAMGISANAAKANWTFDASYNHQGGAADGLSAYFFDSAQVARTDMITALSNNDFADLLASYGGAASDLTLVSTGDDIYGYADGTSKRTDYGNPESITGYIVLFDTDISSSDPKFAFVSEEATKATGSMAGAGASFDFTSQMEGSATSANWVSIAPEPTSGLLLLLGVAGLALRRRRA